MAEINLLKDSTQARKSFSMEGPGKSIALYITGGLLVLELLLYGGLFWYEGNLEGQIAAADRAAADVDLEISKTSAERQEATSYQNRLQNLETVLGNHLLWTAFMAELERVSLKIGGVYGHSLHPRRDRDFSERPHSFLYRSGQTPRRAGGFTVFQ